jgi:ribose 5-phosphate isomerase B
MKIALGADHGGFNLKEDINKFLSGEGYKTTDYGTKSPEACDYPLFAYKVAKAVSDEKADLGILICKSGNGMAMVANKLPNVRAAICFDKNVAMLSRQHNNANILVLGSEHLFDEPELIVRTWLESSFEGGRHKRRVDQIVRVETKICESRKKTRSVPRKVKKKK